ncbi:MAG: hypothetical protein JW798_16750, partial [Prolixibacteraceae bacterium]|nr:hypothetical protein [Prolixibacteraceae bacterium]
MTRYTFLIYHEEYLSFLKMLRNTGVVHVKEKAEGIPDDEEVTRKLKLQQDIKDTIRFLKSRKVEPAGKEAGMEATSIIEKVKDLQLQSELKTAELQKTGKEISQLEKWGSFSWKTVSLLQDAGKFIHFFSCSKSKFNEEWERNYNLLQVNIIGSTIYFIVIDENQKSPDIEAELIKLPGQSLDELHAVYKELEGDIQAVEQEMDQLAATGIDALNKLNEKNSKEIDFRKVVLNSSEGAGQKLKILEGWVPEEKETQLAEELDKTSAYYLKSEPTVNDNVPVLLKNNAFAKIFEMIGSLYSLPSYREIDLTPFFAPFFMLFFGFCLGDAGYGLLMMAATLFIRAKAKPNMKPVWTLGLFFGISTSVMGILSGTFFGINLIETDIQWLTSLKNIMLGQNQLMIFSVILGIIQIVFGICLKAARTIKIQGLKYALSTIGWVVIIVGAGGSFGLSKAELINPDMGKYLMLIFGVAGAIPVMFFNSPGKNPFINLGLGLWDTYGTVTGLLGDVLS